jgi:hypothetical protein
VNRCNRDVALTSGCSQTKCLHSYYYFPKADAETDRLSFAFRPYSDTRVLHKKIAGGLFLKISQASFRNIDYFLQKLLAITRNASTANNKQMTIR